MKFILANVGSIEKGEVALEAGRLNIKYAANGTGKSTFAKFMKATINGEEDQKERFVTFGSSAVPSLKVEGASLSSCMLFDEDYIQSFLFQPDDVLHNTIRLVKLNSDVSQAMALFNSSVADLKKAASSFKIREFLQTAGSALEMVKKNADGSLNGTCKLAKATKAGANVLHPDDATSVFKENIESNEAPSWYKWHTEGNRYLQSDCPFCGQKLPASFDRIREALKALFGKTDAKNNIEARQKLLDASRFLSSHSGIDGLLSTTVKPSSDEYEKMTKDLFIMKEIKERIEVAMNMDPLDLRRMNLASFTQKITDLRIDVSLVSEDGFVSELGLYNHQLDLLTKAADSLQDAVQKCDKAISGAVGRFKKFINDYLTKCGIPYSFEIEQNSSEQIKTKLVRRLKNGTSIGVEKDSLSYGERNCLCLALFALDVCQTNPDIILLDDPISSFDQGKRFAMFYLLFSNEDFNFKNRTVVLLTHDITPLIDFIKRKSGGVNDAKGWRMINNKGTLSEREVRAEDIDSSISIEKSLASDEKKPLVVRLIHARKYLEISGNKGAAYDFVSSLFHGEPEPSVKIAVDASRPFTSSESSEASKCLRELLLPDDYLRMVQLLQERNLVSEYKRSTDNYERMAIARVLLDRLDQKLGKPFDYVMNSVFHIEQENLFNCKLFAEESIPQYVVDFVDARLSEKLFVQDSGSNL